MRPQDDYVDAMRYAVMALQHPEALRPLTRWQRFRDWLAYKLAELSDYIRYSY